MWLFQTPPLQSLQISLSDNAVPPLIALFPAIKPFISYPNLAVPPTVTEEGGMKSSIKLSEVPCCGVEWASRWCWHDGSHSIISNFQHDYLCSVSSPYKRSSLHSCCMYGCWLPQLVVAYVGQCLCYKKATTSKVSGETAEYYRIHCSSSLKWSYYALFPYAQYVSSE